MFWNEMKIQSVTLLIILKKTSLECIGRKGTLQCRVPAGFGLLAALVRSPFQ